MKLGIHHREGSFSNYWIDWCKENNVPFKVVNAYSTNIIDDLRECDGFMWHWHHNRYADQHIARQLALSLEAAGVKVFPSVATAWHFDDKVGQKYLMEALGYPLAKSYCFYTQQEALDWLGTATFPLVFKLRGGSGSQNVSLVKNFAAAKKLVHRAFGKGFLPSDLMASAKQKLWEYRRDRKIISLVKMMYYVFGSLLGAKTKASMYRNKEIGYVYFQEFVPDNKFDDRVVIIGERCFCLRRFCRDNDFRASGSGVIVYDHTLFPPTALELAFSLSKKLNSQCLAFDIVYDKHNNPLIVEISYGFATGRVYEICDGYFDSSLNWVNKKVTPQYFMIEDFVADLHQQKSKSLVVNATTC